MIPTAFVAKWQANTRNERAAAQEHFLDLCALLDEAQASGAIVSGDPHASLLVPILVENGSPYMRIAQADIFAPVITAIEARDTAAVLAMDTRCPFGLTAAIFGEENAARALGDRLNVGTVTINDLIVPTADPRVPFTGRRGSGFGVTRGAEGLLEMTSPKTVAVRRGKSTRHYQPTAEVHESLFAAFTAMTHSSTLRERFSALRTLVTSARRLKSSQP